MRMEQEYEIRIEQGDEDNTDVNTCKLTEMLKSLTETRAFICMCTILLVKNTCEIATVELVYTFKVPRYRL